MAKKIMEFVDTLLLRLEEIEEYKNNKFYSKPAKIKGSDDTAIKIFMKRSWYRSDLKIAIIIPEDFRKGKTKINATAPEEVKEIFSEEYKKIMKGNVTFHGDSDEEEKVEFMIDEKGKTKPLY